MATTTGAIELGLVRLVHEAFKVPLWEYLVVLGLGLTVLLYYALDFHFVGDVITGLRGDKVELIFSPLSRLVPELIAKCQVLHKRYRPTVWLCSPHLQTAFVHFHGRAPSIEYKRTLFIASDGGTVALDWLEPDAGSTGGKPLEQVPVVIIIPGLSSDSSNAYLKHLAHGIASKGWRPVIANHRGLGGISLTSNTFYNAGWTTDIRAIVADIHRQYPESVLLGVGTSLGANMLVKYLGEEGQNTLLKGAVSICCPWDLVVCDRFISRRPLQKLYDKALAIGLTDFVSKHEKTLSSLDTWNFVKKARSVRTFDNFFTRLVGKFDTVDDYYRRSSCVYVLSNVAVPLLCVNSLDDPLCTKEAIPWDECRINSNVLLAVTRHGGHLAYYEGLTAKRIWWVRAATEFLAAVMSSPSPQKILQPDQELEAKGAMPDIATVAEEVVTPQDAALAVAMDEGATSGDHSSSEKGQLTVQLSLRSRAEVLALEKALSQVLEEDKETVKPQEQECEQWLTRGQALLLVAVPLVGAAVAMGLRRKGFFKRLM